MDNPDKTQPSIKSTPKKAESKTNTKIKVSSKPVAKIHFGTIFFAGFFIAALVTGIGVNVMNGMKMEELQEHINNLQGEKTELEKKAEAAKKFLGETQVEIKKLKHVAKTTSEAYSRMIASENSPESDTKKCDEGTPEDCFNEGMRLEKLGNDLDSLIFIQTSCERGFSRACLKRADRLALVNFKESNKAYDDLCNKGNLQACRRMAGIFKRESDRSDHDERKKMLLLFSAFMYKKSCDQRSEFNDDRTSDDCSRVGWLTYSNGYKIVGIKYSIIACRMGKKSDCDRLKIPLSDLNLDLDGLEKRTDEMLQKQGDKIKIPENGMIDI
jgi:hypothetical protein